VATSLALGRVRPRRVLIAVGAALLFGACVLALARSFQPQRTSLIIEVFKAQSVRENEVRHGPGQAVTRGARW